MLGPRSLPAFLAMILLALPSPARATLPTLFKTQVKYDTLHHDDDQVRGALALLAERGYLQDLEGRIRASMEAGPAAAQPSAFANLPPRPPPEAVPYIRKVIQAARPCVKKMHPMQRMKPTRSTGRQGDRYWTVRFKNEGGRNKVKAKVKVDTSDWSCEPVVYKKRRKK